MENILAIDEKVSDEAKSASKIEATFPSPFAEPGRLNPTDYKQSGLAATSASDAQILPAVDVIGSIKQDGLGFAGQKPSPNFVDAGRFEVNADGMISKTISVDGKKVREFGYSPANPTELTKVTIDGNRQFFKSQYDAKLWDTYDNGIFVGGWRGTIEISKNGVYSFQGEKDAAPHRFGSGNDELTAPAQIRPDKSKTEPNTVAPVLPAYEPIIPSSYVLPVIPSEIRPSSPMNPSLPQPPESARPQPPVPAKPSEGPSLPIRPPENPVVPEKPPAQTQTKPPEKPQPPSVPPEKLPEKPPEQKPKPVEKIPVRPHYETADFDSALRAAASNGLLVYARIGSESCGPCRTMESSVWPGIERDYRGKGVFIHIDADKAISGAHGAMVKEIADKVEGYPTIMVFRASIDASNRVHYEQVRDNGKPRVISGGMATEQTLQFLKLSRR